VNVGVMRCFLCPCDCDSGRQDAHNTLIDVICRQTWPQCQEWRARNQGSISFARSMRATEQVATGLEIEENRGNVWKVFSMTRKSVSIDQRPVPKNVDRENGLLGSSEFHLVAAARNGHAAAFDALCHPHTKRLFRSTYRITKNREDAEDALQDSFLRAFVHIHKFDGRSSFLTWLTRIAINSALMILRKKRASRETALGVPEQLDTKRLEWEVADHASNPEEECSQSEMGKILRAEIRDLRPTLRAVFEIKHLQEFSLRETAGKMGISLSAAKARAFHGRSALRKALTLRMDYRGGDLSLPHNVGTIHRRRLSQG
jgi:RNA polymerase sigma-70 factor (ECF subfamily)